MDFAFSEEQDEFRAMLRRFLEERWSITDVRKFAETPAGYDRGVWKQMAEELGLQGLGISRSARRAGLRLPRSRHRARRDGAPARGRAVPRERGDRRVGDRSGGIAGAADRVAARDRERRARSRRSRYTRLPVAPISPASRRRAVATAAAGASAVTRSPSSTRRTQSSSSSRRAKQALRAMRGSLSSRCARNRRASR